MASPIEDGTHSAANDGEKVGDLLAVAQAQKIKEEDQHSPKRKQSSFRERGGGDKPEPEARRRRVDSRTSWRTRVINSLRRKRVVASPAVIEASDFTYRQPLRGSPIITSTVSNKRVNRESPSPDILLLNASKRAFIGHEGGTPLHYYVWVDNRKKEKTDFLVSLLTEGEVDVNSKTEEGNTALHLAVKKGDTHAVKVLLSFGADVNLINNRGQTPRDIATAGYIIQERRLAAIDSRLRQRQRDSPISSRSDFHQDSPVLSKIVPQRPKFIECHLNGDFDGWVRVDFTDGPPIKKKQAAVDTNTRVRDLTDPVQITIDDMQQMSRHSQQVSTPETNKTLHSTTEEDEQLRRSYDNILNLLHATGGMTGHEVQHTSSKPLSLSGQHAVQDLSTELQRSIRLAEYEEGTTILNLYEALEDTINRRMEELASLGNPNEAIALALQQKEMRRYNKTLHKSDAGEEMDSGAHAGSRILCLDGGGIRGLIQIEVLSQIERITGRKIIHLFDWIIGTSTGALIALCLTYGNMSVEEIRLLYFRMKNEVFTRSSYGFDTRKMERLLQETFPPHMCMDCIQEPNVLVSAVYKKVAPIQLHFFNNCFKDEYSKQPVWKVARYTTAAPMFFKECDDYVDGGVLANNPSETGLTAIQNFHHANGSKLPIALVVSVGSGIYPAEALGKIDVQDFLFFGKQWFNLQDTIHKRAKNLIQLLSNALVESEVVAENTKARCDSQGIPFFRFSPKLAITVATGETDNGILIDMLISTIIQTLPGMEKLRDRFGKVADAIQKERYRKRKAKITAKVTSV